MLKTINLQFKDRATLDQDGKNAISVRDGVLEYMGAEIGMEPENKIFTVLRTPATIANAAMKMAGIPVTDEHVSLSKPAPSDGGRVVTAEMIDSDEDGIATIAIKNKLELSDQMIKITDNKRELSLGYFADLVEHDKYDFEQKNIVPHHLAIVDSGRCGSMCSFIDRKPNMENNKMKIKFIDAEGVVNMKTIMEVISLLPEAIKNVPMEKIQEMMPSLLELVEASKEIIPEVEEVVEEADEVTKVTDEDDSGDDKNVEVTDEEVDEDEKDKKDFSDSKEFTDAVAKAAKLEAGKTLTIISKAKTFLDDRYSFDDKSNDQIMKDAIKTQSSDKFQDAELYTAFKLLKKFKDYGNFGKVNVSDEDKEMKAFGDRAYGEK